MFKIGDIVVCIDDSNSLRNSTSKISERVKVGSTYEVIDYEVAPLGGQVTIWFDSGEKGWLYGDRFVLATNKVKIDSLKYNKVIAKIKHIKTKRESLGYEW